MKKIICLLLAAAMLLALTGCGKAQPETTEAPEIMETTKAPADMAQLYSSMTDKLPGMLVLDEEMLMNFCGIDAADCAQVVAAIADAGMAVDEVWLVEAVDEAAADKIQELANTRLRMKGEETVTYAPDLYEIVEKGQIIRNGVYVALVVTEEAEALAQLVNEAIGQ